MAIAFDLGPDDLPLWLAEADEQIRVLADGLLVLERERSDPAILQAVFRAAHTLKGSAAAIGHRRMAELTHALESVLDQVRQGRLVPAGPVVDAALAALDALQALKDEVSTGEPSDAEVEPLVAGLRAVAGDARERQQAPAGATTAGEAVASVVAALPPYRVDVRLQPNSEWHAVRAFQVLTELGTIGRVGWCDPPLETIERGECGPEVRCTLETDRSEAEVRELAAGVPEVVEVHVTLAEAARAEARQPAAAGPPAAVDRAAGVIQGRRTGRRPVGGVVRVDIARLDALMNLVGELVIDRTRLQQIGRRLAGAGVQHEALRDLTEMTQHLGRVTDELQEQVTLSRLIPIDTVFSRFPRVVRDVAHRAGRRVRLVIEGEQTELDRSVIEEIGDPLIHLLRNAVDHGIEPPAERLAAGKPAEGLIRLAAEHQESHIIIVVQDDGCGLDPARLRDAAVRKGLVAAEAAPRISDGEARDLIFLPGFSTAERVTDVSGRGVGLDIVRTNIQRLSGTVEVASEVGGGTSFRIKLPLTLAIISGLLVRVGDSTLAVPLNVVVETLRLRREDVRTVTRHEMVVARGRTLPLVRLGEHLGLESATRAGDGYVVVVRAGAREAGLVVDDLVGEQDVVIKTLGEYLGELPGIAGATILGDGRVSIILDVARILEGLERRGARRAAA